MGFISRKFDKWFRPKKATVSETTDKDPRRGKGEFHIEEFKDDPDTMYLLFADVPINELQKILRSREEDPYDGLFDIWEEEMDEATITGIHGSYGPEGDYEVVEVGNFTIECNCECHE